MKRQYTIQNFVFRPSVNLEPNVIYKRHITGGGGGITRELDDFDKYMYVSKKFDWVTLGDPDKNHTEESIRKFLEDWWKKVWEKWSKSDKRDNPGWDYKRRMKEEEFEKLTDQLRKNLSVYEGQKLEATRAILKALGDNVEEEERWERALKRHRSAYDPSNQSFFKEG